jgi:large subunit ribosomal protein L23
MASTIIIKPVVTEKANTLSTKLGKYTFIVDRKANKIEIGKAIAAMYGVGVESVNTCVRPGKRKYRYTKKGVIAGQTSATKRAIVTLTKGDVIDFYGGVSSDENTAE